MPRLTPLQIANLIAAAVASMVAHGIIDGTTGLFTNNTLILELEDVAAVSADVVAAMKKDGVTVPAKVDEIIAALPGILSIAASLGA